MNQCPHAAGAANATAPRAMKQMPISGTTFTEKAPPVATAVPYNSSQHPGSLATRPVKANTGVRTMPATSGGRNASAKRSAGAAFDSGVPDRFDLIAMATRAIVAASTAAASQMTTQRKVSSGGPAMGAVTSAVRPMKMPPQPGTAVNSLARDMASRMKRRFSRAWAWIGSGRAIKSFIAQRAAKNSSGLWAGASGRGSGVGLCAEEQDGDLHEVAHTVCGGAEEHVLDEAVTVRRHRNEIDRSFGCDLDQLRRRIAHREARVDGKALAGELRAQRVEVCAIGPHLLRLAQFELVEVARGPPVGHMDQQQLRAGQPRELGHVIDDRPVGAGVLHRDEDAPVHQTFQPRNA